MHSSLAKMVMMVMMAKMVMMVMIAMMVRMKTSSLVDIGNHPSLRPGPPTPRVAVTPEWPSLITYWWIHNADNNEGDGDNILVII